MTVKFTNNASTTVGTGINASATSLTVASASSFPSLSGADDYCYLTIQQSTGTVREVVKATALSGNTFTIVRAQDNTSAGTWSAGDIVELRMTAALLTDVIDAATVEGVKTNFQYTPTAGQTVFSGADNASNTMIINQAALVSVYLNGIRLVQGSDYSVSSANNTVTLTAGVTTADIVDVEVFGNFTGQSGAAVAITGGAISGASVAATTLSASGTATLNTFVSSNATISGGTINNVNIGGTTAGTVAATTLTANSVAVDNITIDGTEIDLSSGNFLLDVAGNIQFDTDTGVIYLQDAGTTWLQVNRATNDAEFYSAISDGDIVFKGNDASSTVTALTLDMSAAGNVQARRARSNTAGEVALSVQPSDSVIHYGFRIDSSTNSFNLDRVDTSPTNLLSVDTSGNATFSASVTSAGLTSSGPINLTAGALAAAGNAGLSHRSSDNKVYLQAGTGGFNILDDQQNTHFYIDSAGASTFSGIVTASRFINGSNSSDPWLKGINSSGTETSFIKKDGSAFFSSNVGIGDSDPDTLLMITGDAAALTIEDSGSYSADSVSSFIGFNGKDAAGSNRDLAYINIGQHAGGNGTGSIDFQTRISGTVASRLKIDSSGNVGIGGVTAANRTLQLKGASNNDGFIGTFGSGMSIQTPRDPLTGTFSNTSSAAAAINLNTASADSSISFWTTTVNNAVPTQRMTIDKNGNVGIGTQSPYKKLTISAAFGTQKSDLLDLQSTTGGGGTQPMIRFGTMAANSNTMARIGVVDIPNYGGGFVVETNSSGGATDTTTEKFRIDKDGNLGLGVGASTGTGKITASLAGVAVTGDTDGATMGGGGIVNLYNSNGGVTDSTVMILGSNSATTTGQLASGIGFTRENNNNWGTQLRFYTHSTSTSDLDELNEAMRVSSHGCLGVKSTSPRSDVALTSGTAISTKRWGFGGGISGSNDVFYVINEGNAGVYIVHGQTAWTAHSDERIKENIVDVGTVLPSLMNMRCVKYNLISNPDDTKIGFIAQDWESSFPEIIDENDHLVLEDDGTVGTADESDSTTPVKAMAYTETIPLLLKAIQELSSKVDEQAAKITALENN